jgi:hypothetical protein
MKNKPKYLALVPPKKRQRVEEFGMRSACGNGIVANKGFRKPNANRFTSRSVLDPNANRSLSELLGIKGGQSPV